MGITCCCIINLFNKLQPADWIALIGIIINSILAIRIINVIQNKITNKRILKDHFISEIKNIRDEYKECLNELLTDKVHPQQILATLKLMNIKTNDIMIFLNQKYRIDKKTLHPFQITLKELITNNEDYINSYKKNKVVFSVNSKSKFITFQQSNNNLFNDIIIKINDHN